MCWTPDWYPPEGLAEIVGPGRLSCGDHMNIWQVGITELGSQLELILISSLRRERPSKSCAECSTSPIDLRLEVGTHVVAFTAVV